ncbi:hypothetical protein C9374_004289 [Naegleria lovaniensis]|uniref:Uncharacterized protein n=1 Tax=Naegleria lovaniensis TaxID=51637 RepID=A0AA88GSE7_NAELO|nr:uncharacterized protein C9374_004289 [Naegleria lovaniensis]KAG2383618.1 hypothetical protein C9374_004289 [Naegleria lovaniensis]
MDPTSSAYSDIQDHEIETDSEPIGLELEQPMDTDVVENTRENNICSEKKPPSRTSVSRTSSASSARSFRIYKETSNARNQNSTCVESRCMMENIINSATTFSEDINKKLEYVSPNVSPRNNCSTPQLPKIGKRHDTPNSSSFSDHIQLTSEVQLHVTGREMSPRAEKHPQHSFSVGNVLSKAGLPIKKKSKLGSHWPTSHERLPRYSKVYSSPPSHRNNYYTDEIRNVPNSELTCHSPNCKSPLSKATTPTKNLINSSERLKALSTPKKVLDDKDVCSENYLEKTSSFSNPSSPLIRSQIKQWNGLSEKDTLVHSLISNTQDEEELKTLKYKLGSMLSYENKKTKPPLLETMENFIVTELQSVKSQMTQDNNNDIEFQIAKAQQNAELERQVAILKSNEKALLHTIDKLGMDLKLHEKRRIDEIKRGTLLNDAIQHRENKEVEIKKQLSEMKSVANEKSKIERMYQESIMELDKRSDMVPKGEYQRLRDMNDQLENELNSLKVKFSQEQRVSKLLNEKMNEIKLTNNMMEEKLLDLSRSHTPRPKWSEIRQDLKVDSLPLDSSTSGNVNQLLQRMTKLQALIRKQQRELQENAKALEFLKTEDIIKSRMYSSNFIGQGTGPSVPKYLKFRGKVRNKKFRKKKS